MPKIHMGGSTVSSTNGARKTGCQHIEVGSPGARVISGCENTGMPLIYPSTHKNQPQMNQRPSMKLEMLRYLEEKYGLSLQATGVRETLL